MKYGSVCSGIEATSVAWHDLDMQPSWFAEIEAFPNAVLRHHFPDVANLHDFTRIGSDHGPVDLLVGGTPCQSFSVAGKRLGLDDPRGNLALEFLALAYRLRARWFLWENVPGVLSSAKGEDFAAFLSAATGCFVRKPKGRTNWRNAGVCQSKDAAHFGVAYRVLDAQYFGVPQRRRRVFVVGYLGDWRFAAAVLFERASLSGHPAPRRGTGSRVAALSATGVGASGPDDNQAQAGHLIQVPSVVGFETGPSQSRLTDTAPTMDSRAKDGPIRNQLGLGVLAFQERGRDGGRQLEYQEDQAYSLNNPGEGGRGNENLVAYGGNNASGEIEAATAGIDGGCRRLDFETETFVVRTDQRNANGSNQGEGDSFTLDGANGQAVMAFDPLVRGSERTYIHRKNEQAQLRAATPDAVCYHENRSGSVSDEDVARARTEGASHSYQGVTHPLTSEGFDASEDGGGRGTPIIPAYYSHDYNQDRIYSPDGVAPAHNAQDSNRSRNLLVDLGQSAGRIRIDPDNSKTLASTDGGMGAKTGLYAFPDSSMAVRRLTPREAERLQGFPDDFTLIEYRGKPAADGPRYRALGNSMAVPVMRWLGERITHVDSVLAKLPD